MKLSSVGVVARFTLLEALRTRLPWLALAVIVSGVVLAECAAGLALTDSQSYRIDLYAAWTRITLVACTSLFVATSVVRELSDRAIDLTLSRPLSRGAWFCGRLLGYGFAVWALALLAALPLMVTSTPLAALAWGCSLAAELSLVAAASLSCAVALAQVTAAVLAVAAFYLLSRAMGAIVLMSHGPTVDAGAWSSVVIARLVNWLALLLPALDDYTRTSWLSDATAAFAALPAIAVQTVIYAVLLAAVGLFDFTRREI
jgi:ABC-type transport system involved in multi-copper enzyme maturation permease subunit